MEAIVKAIEWNTQTFDLELEVVTDFRLMTVYEVIDNGKRMYVGNTATDLKHRRRNALYNARTPDKKKNKKKSTDEIKYIKNDRYHKWLKAQQDINPNWKPEYRKIDSGPLFRMKQLEEDLTMHIERDGLLNTRKGGGHISTYKHTEETKKYLSKIARERHKAKNSN